MFHTLNRVGFGPLQAPGSWPYRYPFEEIRLHMIVFVDWGEVLWGGDLQGLMVDAVLRGDCDTLARKCEPMK
jgi:hypothetical protein